MFFKQIIMTVICVFFTLGVIDYFIGNKFGLGAEFERAFFTVGRIMLVITGTICLSPVLARMLQPIVTPLFSAIGADSAMFASTILAPDSGALSMATTMAIDPLVGAWSGTVVASHIGSAFSFNIPASINVVPKKYRRDYSLGALSGLIACPFGCILGGLIAGLRMGVIMINLVPALVVSLLVALGLYFIPNKTMKGFVLFGRGLMFIILIGLVAATIERLVGITVIEGMKPVADAFLIAGTIGLTMAGIFCMTVVLSKVLKRQLAGLSRIAGINELSILHILNSLASIYPGLLAYENLDQRGRVVFAAFCLSGACVFGAHLGFVGTVMPEMLMPTVVAKLFSGVVAIVIALLFASRLEKQEKKAAIEASE